MSKKKYIIKWLDISLFVLCFMVAWGLKNSPMALPVACVCLAIIGVIALRFTSGLFIKWLEIYINLEKAGYIAVGIIGLKLIIQLVLYKLVIPEYLFFLVMLCLFLWGFSRKESLIDNV